MKERIEAAAEKGDDDEYERIIEDHKKAVLGDDDPYQVSRGLRDIEQYVRSQLGPASGTETTGTWNPQRDPKTGRPIAGYKPPKPKPTGKVMSADEMRERQARNQAYNEQESKRRDRESAERGLRAYLSHEVDGGTLSDDHARRKADYVRILGLSQRDLDQMYRDVQESLRRDRAQRDRD